MPLPLPRQRLPKRGSVRQIPLQQPDRSKPDVNQETLLHIAAKRGLWTDPNSTPIPANDGLTEESGDPPIGRLGEAILWSISLAMLHFTFDVLVQHQYAVAISWPKIITAALQAFGVFFVLCYMLHPHPSPSPLLPRFPPRYQAVFLQLIFFVGSVASGCYLIYITNEHSYLAVMKRAPPVGCMWVWSVIELDLTWAVPSLICCGAFLWWRGYSYS